MPFTSYSDLKTTVASYLARSDLTTVIPDFVRLAEERLRRDIRTRQMLVVAIATTTGGGSTVGLPTDFLERLLIASMRLQGLPRVVDLWTTRFSAQRFS